MGWLITGTSLRKHGVDAVERPLLCPPEPRFHEPVHLVATHSHYTVDRGADAGDRHHIDRQRQQALRGDGPIGKTEHQGNPEPDRKHGILNGGGYAN